MVFRIRKEDANGDYAWGHGQADFHVDSSQGVGLLLKYRLNLWTGQWFLDLEEGTPYFQRVLGKSVAAARDAAIRDRVATTPFVETVTDFAALGDPETRRYSVSGKVATRFTPGVPLTVAVTTGG